MLKSGSTRHHTAEPPPPISEAVLRRPPNALQYGRCGGLRQIQGAGGLKQPAIGNFLVTAPWHFLFCCCCTSIAKAPNTVCAGTVGSRTAGSWGQRVTGGRGPGNRGPRARTANPTSPPGALFRALQFPFASRPPGAIPPDSTVSNNPWVVLVGGLALYLGCLFSSFLVSSYLVVVCQTMTGAIPWSRFWRKSR